MCEVNIRIVSAYILAEQSSRPDGQKLRYVSEDDTTK